MVGCIHNCAHDCTSSCTHPGVLRPDNLTNVIAAILSFTYTILGQALHHEQWSSQRIAFSHGSFLVVIIDW